MHYVKFLINIKTVFKQYKIFTKNNSNGLKILKNFERRSRFVSDMNDVFTQHIIDVNTRSRTFLFQISTFFFYFIFYFTYCNQI